MNIFDYFFSCFRYIINILDHDFFGLGFSYLDFFLAVSLIFIILKFLLQGFGYADGNNFFSFTSIARDFSRDYRMKNNERENQIVTINNDLDNRSTTIISSKRNYDKKGRLTSIINDKHKF